jgi:hypothetical protein
MSCCNIYNRPLLFDANYTNASIDISRLSRLVPSFNVETSGIWLPIIIKSTDSTLTKADILSQAGSSVSSSFDPVNCAPLPYNYDVLETDNNLICNYCDPTMSYSKSWQLKDTDNNVRQVINIYGQLQSQYINSNCCNGACDTMMKKDDYLPKIPTLNQISLTKFYDFKHLYQFPSTNNPGLGFQHFISFPNNSLSSFSSSPPIMIDWKLKESIGEIPYDIITSQYDTSDQHKKAYNKSLQVSKTCGNFILTQLNPSYSGLNPYYPMFSGLIGESDQTLVSKNINDLLPPIENFQKTPYGFSRNTYDNIFVKNEKIGSHWKWNYNSGILCWYRYYDKDAIDSRPIKGVDLYISPGDVFYATNEGPELAPSSDNITDEIKNCPSGLKLLKGNSVTGVIPHRSNFVYISANLYENFRNIYDRINIADKLDETNMSMKAKFELAALMCTSPQYDQITIDLLKRNNNYDYTINSFKQISGFNKDMSTSNIGSIAGLGFIKSKKDLINTLGDKYGPYLWCEPNTTSTLTLNNSLNSQCYIDLDFDMVINNVSDTRFYSTNCTPTTDCSANIFSKVFAYNQKFSLGSLVLESKIDTKTKYKARCVGSSMEKYQSARMAGFYLNNSLIKEYVYSSGCYTLQNNYPRIITNSTPLSQYCSRCDEDSSYKLPNINITEICDRYQGSESWCDARDAFRANNSDGANVTGTRLGRFVLDGSKYFKRSYPVSVFNPHIDRLAFHSQGGIFYASAFNNSGSTVFVRGINSMPQGNLSLTFETKDVGIKIFNVKIEKLRGSSSDSYNCRAFPIKDSCKCFGLNTIPEYPYTCNSPLVFTNDPVLFTPGLSTVNSPKIQSYGGFSSDQLSSMIGSNTIPNHPAIGTNLSVVSKKIDPLNPYGCEKSVTITLNNYAATTWSATLPSYDTIHADIWAEILEGVDLFKPTNSQEDFETGEMTSSSNLGYQRYTNLVKLNDSITIYDQQKKKFIDKGGSLGSSVSIKLVNPYLAGLLGAEYILYPPVGNFCDSHSIFGGRGDEISSVPIKFSRIPRKQILNFAIKTPSAMGTLSKGFFHPNSGLIIGDPNLNNKTSINHDLTDNSYYIDYDKDYFRSDKTFNSGSIFIGDINQSFKKVIEQINNFDNHKKLRLYLQLPDGWYEYAVPNTFGFINEDSIYIGEPYLFEYLKQENHSISPGSWLPSCPKKPIEFDFVYNFYPTGNSTFAFNNNYPIYHISFTKSNNIKKVLVDGIRSYFYVAEKDTATVAAVDSITNLSSDEQDLISEQNPDVVLTNGTRWRYIGGSKNNYSSYRLSDYNYLYTNFSDLHINYSLHNKAGYVYNSKKTCDQEVVVINKKNLREKYTCKIIEKSIYIKYVDKNNNFIKSNNSNKNNNQFIRTYTALTFDKELKYDEAYLDFTKISDQPGGSQGIDSIIIYKNINPALKSESDSLLNNQIYSTKWTDLIDFDKKLTNELSNYIYNKNYLRDNYPNSTYNNNFNKIVINNSKYKLYNYLLKTNNQTLNISQTGLVYYTIHQKYNIGLNDSLIDSDWFNHHNFLPFMDINFIPAPGENTNNFRSNISSFLNNNNIISGTIIISGIHANLPTNHEWGSFINPSTTPNKFWINFNTGNMLRSAISFSSDVFYSNTLRIDDVPMQLSEVNHTTLFNGQNCLRTFTPSIPSTNIQFSSNKFNFNHFTKTNFTTRPFARYPIYCDTDTVGNCDSRLCGINTVGWSNYSGKYDIFVEKTKPISILSNTIPYILSYDAGLYNPIGNNQLHYIQRFELDPDNPLYPVSSNPSYTPRPSFNRYSILNEEYQNTLTSSIVDDHTTLVKNTDSLANEMFFRLVYGQKQKINLQRIDESENPITLIDLIKYSDPKIEAKDLYKNIPYDLDIGADISKERQINGSISIDGKAAVGARVSVEIENTAISISIQRNNGKINIVAEMNGISITGQIYEEQTRSKSLVVSTNSIFSPASNQTYTQIGNCKERAQKSINLSNKITSATIIIDQNGTEASFPYWQDESNPRGAPCPDTRYIYGHKDVYIAHNGGCAPNALPYDECTNRGVGPISIPNGCEGIGSKKVTFSSNGWSRGVQGGCHWNGASVNPQFDSGNTNYGPLESFDSGTIVDDVIGYSKNPRYATSECGTCFSLTAQNTWNDNQRYNIFGSEWPPSPSSTGDSCECDNYSYGYCRSSDKIDGCACKSLNYEYSDFDYNFEYARHSITLKGHKRKLVGKLRDPDIISDNISCNKTGEYAMPGPVGVLTANEECLWYSCVVSQPTRYYIYEIETINNNLPYTANCSTHICTINYTNNNITISLPNKSQCFDNTINNCPKLKVTVPDDSFVVNDSLTSECSYCDVGPNRAVMTDQSPPWDIITETRTCVLGYLLQGNPNENGPVSLGGCQTIYCNICKLCPDANSCRGWSSSNCGYGQCGKPAPDSFPWHTCITKTGGSECTPGNYFNIHYDRDTSGLGPPAVVGCDIGVHFPIETSNNDANRVYVSEWKANMKQAYMNIAVCKNNINTYDINDIIEGVVPGSCSQLNFGSISYPAIQYRATTTDPQFREATVTVLTASYTYSYRRPKNVQDILKGVDTSIKCNEFSSHCDTNNLSLRSKYKTDDCETGPHCYNRSSSKCDNDQACCRANRIEYD